MLACLPCAPHDIEVMYIWEDATDKTTSILTLMDEIKLVKATDQMPE